MVRTYSKKFKNQLISFGSLCIGLLTLPFFLIGCKPDTSKTQDIKQNSFVGKISGLANFLHREPITVLTVWLRNGIYAMKG